MLLRATGKRRGATVVELAAVAPILMLLIFGLVIGGLGVFRYHQVASLAREAARHAAVRGSEYARETGKPAATQDSIRKEVVEANAAGLDPALLTCTVSWDKSNAPKAVNADQSATTNVVTVTVTYKWLSEAYFGGITLTSTSKVPMSF
jgi:Flp pilus assembly protein TadG